MMRFTHLVCLGLLVICACALPPTAAENIVNSHNRKTISGWVDIHPDVSRYATVGVVDGTGTMIRTFNLDSTHAFSFAHMPRSSVSVKVMIDTSANTFAVNEAESVLSAPITEDGVYLKVATAPLDSTRGGMRKELHGPFAALVTLLVLAGAWFGRHTIVSCLHLPAFKAPKQQKVMMGR